ncbi:MAG: hypothetical protein PHZ07_02610 [Patescibacteria group bacterium]|nr:hypothetical protein [Patescibacteria group bacterium]MDD4304688.1 hypothetical protein [Patescibacteria group bacterium]MDD4695344.1 hypothetical protein [Patescibacteria group bacterium]
MNLDKWNETKSNILDSFDVIKQEILKDDDGHGEKDIIEFKSPMGDVKIEFHTRDLVLDKHSNFSNRIGSNVTVDYKYSDTEKTHKLRAYKKDGDNWSEIDNSMFS